MLSVPLKWELLKFLEKQKRYEIVSVRLFVQTNGSLHIVDETAPGIVDLFAIL